MSRDCGTVGSGHWLIQSHWFSRVPGETSQGVPSYKDLCISVQTLRLLYVSDACPLPGTPRDWGPEGRGVETAGAHEGLWRSGSEDGGERGQEVVVE